MTDYFWNYAVGDDTAEHARRGIGPASDYQTPQGTPLHAPFAGLLETFYNAEGGYGVRLYGDRYTYVGQHNEGRAGKAGRRVAWRESLDARSGNTGSQTTGPHHHAYIIDKVTGERMSFSTWLRRVRANAPLPTPPTAPVGVTGKTLDLTKSWYWYKTPEDAAATYRPKGGKYGGGIMLSGPYPINEVMPNGAVKVTSRSVGTVYLHPSALTDSSSIIR